VINSRLIWLVFANQSTPGTDKGGKTMDFEELILAWQEDRDEYYPENEEIRCNRPLEEVYPFLFIKH